MSIKIKTYLKGIAILSGTIIGAGVFVLPWTAVQAGFLLTFFYLLSLTILISLLHLIYAQIIAASPEKRRFPGYLGYYFNQKAKHLGALIIIFLFWGSLLVYLILGGKFLSTFFANNLNENYSTLIFFVLSALPVFWGIKRVSSLELAFLVGFFLIISLSFFCQKNQIPFSSFPKINFSKIFLPYGIIVYSLFGISAIPELMDFLSPKKETSNSDIKKVIVLGTFLPAVFYTLFIVLFLRIIPWQNISPDIIHSFKADLFSPSLKFLLSFFGLMSVLTSFWIIGLNLRDLFIYDFKIKKFLSWSLACLVPLFLYLFNLRNFVSIISFLGSLILGIQGILIILIYLRLKKDNFKTSIINLPKTFLFFLIILFLGTILLQISKLFVA